MTRISDICIIGAGTAGMAAAYALMDTNFKVVIIEKQSTPGGTAVNAWVETWIPGINPPYLKKILKKDFNHTDEELSRTILPGKFARQGKEGNSLYLPHNELYNIYLRDITQSPSIELLCNYKLHDALIENKKIKRIWIQNVNDYNDIQEIEASYFVDASGDGVLASFNGQENIDYYIGEDPYSRFEESLAPNKDISNESLRKQLNEPSLYFCIDSDCNNAVNGDLQAIPYEYRISQTSDFIYNGYCGNNWVNPMTGMNLSGWAVFNYGEKAIYDTAISQINNYWKFIQQEVIRRKKKGEPLYGYNENVLSQWPNGCYAPMLGIRESRRIICDRMLIQQDLTRLLTSSDIGRNIALGSHEIDFHVYGYLSVEEIGKFNDKQLRPSGIPFDCMVPKRFDNVLVACRAYGASHIALAARRINKDMAQLGWAAGNAIKWCLRNLGADCNVRNTNVSDIQSDEYTGFKKEIENIEQSILKQEV